MTVAPDRTRHEPVPRVRNRRTGRIVAAVAGALLLLLGWVLLAAGGATLLAGAAARDGSGFLMGDPSSWSSPGYAVQTRSVVVHSGPMGFDMPHRMLGRFRATAVPTGDDGVFIGIASARDAAHYLRHVARTTLTDPYAAPATGHFVDGGSPGVAPADAGFWVASAVGTSPQQITWDPRPGSWRLVVMNAEGTTPVSADVAVGAEAPGLRPAGWALVAGGLVLLVAATAAALLSMRGPPRTNPPPTRQE